MVKWNLEDLYKFEDTDKLINELKEKVEKFATYREILNEELDPQKFMELIKEKEEIITISQKLGGYAGLWLTEKTDDSERNTHQTKISETITNFNNELIFFGLWFKDVSEKQAESYIRIAGKYAYYLEEIRKYKKYTLKEKEEQIINIKDLTGDEAVTKIYDIITNGFKYLFEGKEVTRSDLVQYVRDPSKKRRKDAYETLLSKYGKNEAVLGEIYKTLVQDWKNENIKIRGFKSPITVRNLGNDISDETVEILLKVIQKNKEVFQEYFKIKAKILGEKKLSRYHLYAPITEFKKEYTYEESKEIVLNAYKEFSETAYNHAKEIFDLEHVHSEIQPGKQSGAFCYTVGKDISPYIMLNHAGKLTDVFTMMHEFGHGIHGRMARGQTQYTFHSTLPMAETASIFGETILEKKMLKELGKSNNGEDRLEKQSLLMYILDGKYASIMRQAYFVIFEKKAHKRIGEGITIEGLNALYLETLKEQFGTSIDIPEVFQHEWKYIPHIYHTPFYCYAYAFGNLMGLGLYKMYEEQGTEFVNKYLEVLAKGGSDKPEKILKEKLGVDISKEEFWQKGFDVIKSEQEELKKLLK